MYEREGEMRMREGGEKCMRGGLKKCMRLEREGREVKEVYENERGRGRSV